MPHTIPPTVLPDMLIRCINLSSEQIRASGVAGASLSQSEKVNAGANTAKCM